MVRVWQTCKSQPLRKTISSNSVRCSDPQRQNPQQTAAKQPLDEPPNASRLPQRLISKPQRQSVGNKRNRLAQHLNLHQVPKPALSKVRIADKEQPEPREINHWLVDASSPEQVLSIFAQHQKRFNIINISTALYRLAKQSKQMPVTQRRRLQAHSSARTLALAALQHMQDSQPRSLSNLAWSQATLQLGPPHFLPKVLELAEHMMLDSQSEKLHNHQLSIICWAAVKENCLTRSCWTAISPFLCHMMPDMAPQVLSNITWVCATAGFHDDLAFIQAAAAAVTNSPEGLRGQVLSNLAWSFAKLGYFEQGLWDALASATIHNADQLRSVELAQLTWAFCQAIADQAANDGIGSLRAEVQQASFEKSFISQQNRDLLLHALRNQSVKLIHEGRMSMLALSTCASAFASIGYYSQTLLSGAADIIARDPIGIGLQVPVNFTWVCSSQRFYHPKFLQGFAYHGLEQLQNPKTAAHFNDMHIATTLRGFASHTVQADDAVCWAFIRALADRAVGMLDDFRPQALANSAWGLAVLGHLDPAFFLKLRTLTLGNLHGIITEELHQLYQVELILRLEAPDLGLDTSRIQDSDALFAALQQHGHFVGVAATSWKNSGIISSDFQQKVALVLESLGLPCKPELECNQTKYIIDIAFPDVKLAIEVDGPLHFMRNAPKPTGRTAVKRRCLQQLGWTVLSVPFFHWNALGDKPLLKQAYMLERLRQAKVWPEGSLPTDLVADTLPEMVVGPLPALVSPDTSDMQTVQELVDESEVSGLLSEPHSSDIAEGADIQSDIDPDQTASKVHRSQALARLSANERKQLLMQKAGKNTKSRYELLLHVALNRRKTAA